MRPASKVAAAALTLAFAAGCADSPVQPNPTETSHSEAAWTEGVLNGEDVQDLQHPVVDLTGRIDARTILPIDLFDPIGLLVPAPAGDIGPGSAIIITIPNEGSFGCTANFVFTDRGVQYLGAAGHCFLPPDRTATHGPGADYDASGVVVEVCVSGCEGNFDTNQLLGTWVELGNVAYARQQTGSQAVGHDFGVVEIPAALSDRVRTSMPVWGGPTGTHTLALGDPACHYGNGVVFGEVFLTKARVGVGGGSTAESWAGDFAAAFGDSGSGLVACEPAGATLAGAGAVGVLTHLGVRLDPATGEHGVVLGTTINRAIAMAGEAGLQLSLVLP